MEFYAIVTPENVLVNDLLYPTRDAALEVTRQIGSDSPLAIIELGLVILGEDA